MKPIKLMAALTALVLAAANTAAIQPNLTTKAEEGTGASEEQGTCTLNFSVVDSETGEAIPDIEATLIVNPTGTGRIIEKWTTTDEIKNITELHKEASYGISLRNVPDIYSCNTRIFFDFENEGDTLDLVIKAERKDSKPNVRILVHDWSDLIAEPEQGLCTGGGSIPDGEYTVKIYDEENGFIKEGKGPMYLPNGDYIATVIPDDKDYVTVSPSSKKAENIQRMYPSANIPSSNTVHFSVIGGELLGRPEVYFTRKSAVGNNSLVVNIIDSDTNEALSGFGFLVYKLSDELAAKAENTPQFIENVENNEELVAAGSTFNNIITDLKAGQKYAVIMNSRAAGFANDSPEIVIVDFDEEGLPQEVTFKLKQDVFSPEWNTAIHVELVTSVDGISVPVHAPMPDECKVNVYKSSGELFGEYDCSGDLYLSLPLDNYTVEVINPDSTKYVLDGSNKFDVPLEKYGLEVVEAFFNPVNDDTVIGDANCDTDVELADAILIMQALANPDKFGTDGSEKEHITEKGWINADVDGSGTMTGNDALNIQRYLLKQIKALPNIK